MWGNLSMLQLSKASSLKFGDPVLSLDIAFPERSSNSKDLKLKETKLIGYVVLWKHRSRYLRLVNFERGSRIRPLRKLLLRYKFSSLDDEEQLIVSIESMRWLRLKLSLESKGMVSREQWTFPEKWSSSRSKKESLDRFSRGEKCQSARYRKGSSTAGVLGYWMMMEFHWLNPYEKEPRTLSLWVCQVRGGMRRSQSSCKKIEIPEVVESEKATISTESATETCTT